MKTSIRLIKSVIHENGKDAEVGQINEREVSGLHDATQVVNDTQVVDQSNVVNVIGNMINRGDKAKANEREGIRKSPDSQCNALSTPKKRCILSNIRFNERYCVPIASVFWKLLGI